MKITIAGCRGSLPSPSGKLPNGETFSTINYGGNTTCFYLESRGKRMIIDAGTGIAPFGRLMSEEFGKGKGEVDLYVTHTHWDHIQGFPFFGPAYVPGNRVNIYGEAKVTVDLTKAVNSADPQQLSGVFQINGVGIKDVLADQQKFRNFPAPLEYMEGMGGFYDFFPGAVLEEKNGLLIETSRVNHPGGCISYKFTENNSLPERTVVFATDFEPDHNSKDDELIRWWKGADLIICDAQCETGSAKNPFMKGWGHSDPFLDIEFARKAEVKKLLMTHHDPKSDDKYLADLEERVKKYAGETVQVEFAKEGACFEI